MSNSTADTNGTDDWTSSIAGITGGYTGDSLVLKIFIASFFALAVYNSIELNVLVLVTFLRYSGVYFWSLLIASWGIVPYCLGFLLKFFMVTTGRARWGAVSLLTVGWYSMVTGQSVVLWSRLHLLIDDGKVLRWTKYMIIMNVLILHVPTTVLTYGSNGDINLREFVTGYNAYEKVQMLGFFVQECILSGLYIKETIRILRTSLHRNARKFMYQLFAVNIIIIAMDIALVAVEFANLYIIETFLKGVIYSIKLKLEFVVLGKLVQFVTKNPTSIHDSNSAAHNSAAQPGARAQSRRQSERRRSSEMRRRCSSALGRRYGKDEEVPDFVDPNKLTPDYNHVAPPIQSRKNSRPHVTDSELSLALFEHVESAPLPPDQAALAAEKNLSYRYAKY